MTQNYNLYPDYNDAEHDLLGRIPSHWRTVSLKRVISRNDGGVWGAEPCGESDTVVLRSTEQTASGEWAIQDPAWRQLSATEYRVGRLRSGDLLITKSSGSALHIGKTTLVTPDVEALNCCYSNFMQRLRLNSECQPRFGWYLMNNSIVRSQFDLLSNTTTGLANLNGGLIGSVVVPLPPPLEQRTIAAFLDHETARIDRLIEKQQRLIELLKEKRQAVISHAVTKGLNPDAPMKDSGVEWLGQVPAHWTVQRLSHVVDDRRPIMYGIVLPGPDVDEGVLIVKGGDVKPGRLKADLLCKTTHEIEAKYERSRLIEGDLVYSIRGTIGDVELVPREIEGANLTQDAARIAPAEGINNIWLKYVMESSSSYCQLEVGSLGAAVRGINIRDLKKAIIPVPPQSERDEIAVYLTSVLSKIQRLQSNSLSQINLLKERRTALISAAVTGKIDVRNWAPSHRQSDVGLPMAAEQAAEYRV